MIIADLGPDDPRLADFLAYRAAGNRCADPSPDDPAMRLLGSGPATWPRSHGALWRSFLARDVDGQPLGRLTAIINPALSDGDGRPFGQLGFVELGPDVAVATALLATATDWLRSQPAGVRTVLAPMAFDAWHAYRLRTFGMDQPHFAGEPCHPAHLRALLAACGFRPVSEHVTKTILAPGALAAGWARCHARALARGYRFDGVAPEQMDMALGRAYRLSHALFGHLAHFTPLPEGEFRAIYDTVGEGLEPDSLVFAVAPEGRDIGLSYSFRMPGRPDDVYLKTFGVVGEQRGLGLAPALAGEVYRRWLGHGVTRVHHCLMAADDAAARFDRGAGLVTRRYQLLGRAIDGRGP